MPDHSLRLALKIYIYPFLLVALQNCDTITKHNINITNFNFMHGTILTVLSSPILIIVGSLTN
jgi:hypothetical protein